MKALIKSFNLTVDFYQRAHSMHWNVVSPMFPMYHDFFDDVYQEVYSSIDTFAEQIRAVGEVAPSFAKALIDSSLPEQKDTQDATEMVKELQLCNTYVILSLNEAFKEASSASKQGLVNFLADRIDAHSKLDWMLKSMNAAS